MARGHMVYRSAHQPVLLILLSVLQLVHTQSAPQFTRMPTDQIGVQGGVASFVCQATGDPQPKITWSRKGKKVTNQRFEVIEFEDGSGSVLRVQPLRTPRDEAIYECVASNDRGEISASTRLSVLREDQLPTGFPNIDMGPQLKVVERSRTATMLCAASGTPDPEITWFKDFLPIDTHTHGRIKQLRSESFGALQIDQSEETDQGKYECVATNSEGTRYSTPANLYVRELRDVRRIPPRFSVPPMDYEIMPGGSVNISCQAVGVPMPYVKWMLGAEDLTPEDDMPIGRNVLELTDVRQSANYTCVAMSTLGVIETVAQITVKALPNPPGAPVVMERSATSITLMWDSGNPLAVSYYIIQYRPASSTDSFKEIDDIATTRYSVGGLSPYSHYHFRVMAVNSIGRGPPSQTVEARTAEQAPSSPPRRVRGRMLSGSTAMVQWEEPEEANGQVVGYRVYYTSDSSLSVSQWEKEMVRGANFLNIRDLTPNKTYYIRVLAFTAVGDGPLSSDLHIIAKTGVPSQPTELKAEVKSETSILLSWIPPAHSGTDAITGYELIYRLGDQPEQKISFDPSSSYLLKNLKPFSTYIFQLAARSKHGLGAFTSEITVQTPQTLFAVNFRVKAAMKSSVLLTWEPRTTSNKAQSLIISYGDGESVEVDGRLGQKLVTNLKPQSLYTFLLTSKADGIGGLQHRADAMTAPNLLTKKPQLLDKTSSQSIATLQLPAVQGQANVRGFYIVVVPLKRQRGGNFQNLWSDPDEMNIDELLREINGTGRSVRLRRQAEAKAYISSYFQNLPAEFKLGDGRVYGAFMNRPLVNGQEYVCFVLAILELGQNTVYSTSPFSDAVLFSDVEPQPIVDEEEGLLWVVGPVLAVIFIISIVILILLFKSKPDRKRAELEGRKCSFPSNSKAMSSQHPSDPVELRRINFPTAGLRASIIGYRRLSSMTSHPPVSVSELPTHIERMKANDNLRFSQEYESIDPGQQFSWEQSNLEINKSKNRYANVIAYDHTRVSLSNNDGVPGGDYINANFIDGYRRQGAYIATQGPMPDTFSDFWRMVWEQHTANIIMITKLEEKSRMPSYFFSKNKCDQYWPSRGTETYGLMQVSLLDTVELATYCVRTFALFKSGSGEKREVRQFQFTAWPDQGVPEHPTPFLAFLRRVKACNPPDAGPIAVHCSAGVGRTGCFIVIDAMLERVKQEKTIDVYGHVTLMRSQRNYMVQTEEQYIFIYDALLEAVSCGNTEVPARNLYAYIQRLSQTEPPEHISGMEQEFKRLANAKAHNSRFVSASLPCNKFKNRLVNIMPYETTRVCLQPIRGVEGSDYVNGSFIDGYRQQRAYIGTQGPLAETVEDFWRMLWEHNSTIVVMLTKLREMGREKCHQYWPSDRSARYQYFVVDPMAEYNMPQYILREFKVTDARDGQSRTVRQFQFTDWPEQGVPKSGEGFIDFIGQVHKTKEQFGQDGPISVHCSAGVGRTGVFITLSIVLERMRYEGVVDIFQTVKMLRTQRPAMVQTEEQYQFCYRAALEYLGSFDHYAT
ncbi:protein tyrosine phosphatase receptor type Db isoform X3 [Pimephales promelas]|uniref:protein tyrosine phosphatase receptor type Db isoform X3 n=1 Tax=Pimephales promelas TaxID=90988 RepID=UPI001955B212|nr:protein tyrosine phosphatase receptor type Db isoform X3 [Pimephales promelas]XP_039547935.1 protein tyrosine phosphatase receptor type Db isoform X3 [Pimephales promelas]